MGYNSNIHPFSQLIKSFLGHLEKNIFKIKYSNDELIVVNYHSTPKKFDANFEQQVNYFKRNFNIISPTELEDIYFNKENKRDKCSLLFTFDDGLKNNLNAITILEKNNIKALFFVVPEFINMPKEKQKEFYLTNIRPVINNNIDNQAEDFCALSWNELNELVRKGHAVGAHTQTHTLVAQTSLLKNSEFEIVDCKNNIEKALNINVSSFCSINDTLLSVGKKEKELIATNYKFHFTTLPGSNKEKDALLIKRRNVEAFWLRGAVYYAIGKLDLKRWQTKIEEFVKL